MTQVEPDIIRIIQGGPKGDPGINGSPGAPGADGALSAPDALDRLSNACETHNRRYVNNAGITSATQIMRVMFFTCHKAMTVDRLLAVTGNTPASGTPPTTAQLALFREDPTTRDLTRVGITTHDGTLFIAANTEYAVPMQASVPLVKGDRYAIAMLIVGTGTFATFAGIAGTLAATLHRVPRLGAQRTGVASIPSGITDAQLAALPTGNSIYFAALQVGF